jgi:HAD superfamily hydrolase (TIGR01662 family)
MDQKPRGCILFDWGDTLMRDNKNFSTAMKDWPEVEAIPGAAEILPVLHSQWSLAIATNADVSVEKDVRAALNRVNLNQWLDKIYCSKTIGYSKPSTGFFMYILNDLKLSPHSIFMVGDNFKADVLGANRCGIRGVWFNDLDQENRKTHMVRTIHRLSDLPAVLAGWDTV